MWVIKPFEELTARELHLIYKERVAVFRCGAKLPLSRGGRHRPRQHPLLEAGGRPVASLCPADPGSGGSAYRTRSGSARRTHPWLRTRIDASRTGVCKDAFPWTSRSTRKHKPICRIFTPLSDSDQYRISTWRMISRTST